jgi:hypothetical protein
MPLQIPLLAHVGGGELPLPLWQFAYAGLAVVLAAFLLLRSSWPEPRLAAAANGRPVPRVLDRATSIAGVALRILGVTLWAVTLAAAWFGTDNARENLAPNLVWVMLWAGMHLVSAALGDVWRVLSPFDTIAAVAAWVRRRISPARASSRRVDDVPSPLIRSHWLAATAVVGFAWLELCYHSPDEPRVLAIAITAYSAVMLAGAVRFGREWLHTSEMFAVVFGLFAAMAPFFRDDNGRLRARVPLAGLTAVRARPGTVLVVGALIGATVFDGIGATQWWQDLTDDRLGWGRTAVDSVGLAASIAVVVVAYLLAARATVPDGPTRFVASLVPVALGYAIAHYFTLFVVEAQSTLPLVGDPFGRGWDLFGFGSPNPDLAIVSPTTVAWVQAIALVAAHVAAVAVAVDIATRDSRRPVLYALVAFLLASTTASLALMLG